MLLRIAQYIGIAVAFVLGILILAPSGSVTVERAPAPTVPTASTTLSVAATTETPSPAPDPVAPKKIIPPVPKPALAPPPSPVVTSAPVTVTVTAPVAPVVIDNVSLDSSALTLRTALVNIICYAPAGSSLRSISGSGVFIDSKGIILTNAHIAPNFLLKDRGVSCDIRAGSPATDRYEASLIYIPPAWVNANASILAKTAPRGTGEYDFALLCVTKSAEGGSASGG